MFTSAHNAIISVSAHSPVASLPLLFTYFRRGDSAERAACELADRRPCARVPSTAAPGLRASVWRCRGAAVTPEGALLVFGFAVECVCSL